MRRIVMFLIGVLAAATFVQAEPSTKTLVNLDKSGLAIQGYDPVSYQTDNKAVKGDPAIHAETHGATYYFATEEHRAMFEKEPAKYEPLFGGYCGYGASKNRLIPIEPGAFTILDGHLILQKNKDVLGYWNEDPKGTYEKAQANWPKLVEKNGK